MSAPQQQVRAAVALTISLALSSCQSIAPQQTADNAAVLADAFVDYVWNVDPEIYFDDARLAQQQFARPLRAMRAQEYAGLPRVTYGTSGHSRDQFQDSRVFLLDLPLTRLTAIDAYKRASSMQAHVCMLVSARYDDDAAVYCFEFFTPRIAIARRLQLVRNGAYVADLGERSGYAIATSASTVAQELRQRGVPLDFGAGVYTVTGDHGATSIGNEYLMGSGRVLLTHDDAGHPTRLQSMRALVRLGDGLTAQALYNNLLANEAVRTALAEQAKDLTSRRRNGAERTASARAAEDRYYDRIAARERQARRNAMNRAFSGSLANGARNLDNWSRQQTRSTTGTPTVRVSDRTATSQPDNNRVAREVAANERKIAAAQQKKDRERARKKKARLDDDADELKKQWQELTRDLVLVGRDLKRNDFATVSNRHEQLLGRQTKLNRRRKKANLAPLQLASNKVWFDAKQRELEQRAKGVRAPLANMSAPSSDKWTEHLVATIAGVAFYQRVRARTWPDKAVDLAWRVVNTNTHPVWHSLDESKPSTGGKSYLWGGSHLKPGRSHLHEWVTYAADRSTWVFEGFVRREN